MKETHRLDKILARTGYGSRKDVKSLVKTGAVEVNGRRVKDSGMKVDPAGDVITVSGERVQYREFIYIMMNKPDGVISATEDRFDRTVIDLLDEEARRFEPFPVGRLDKDTTGLLLISNDGKLAHELLSPKKHVAKTYAVTVDGPVGEHEKSLFEQGVTLDDGYETMPAQMELVRPDDHRHVLLTIYEGKFHQVKRMFQAVGRKVTKLERVTFGPLSLDRTLLPGQYRELHEEELALLQKHT